MLKPGYRSETINIMVGKVTYLAMDMSNKTRNCLSEVWYITLTKDISVIRKYRMLPLVATGLYSSRALLILISVSAAIWSFWLTSRAVVLVTLSTLIRSSSSTREPCLNTMEITVENILVFTMTEITVSFCGSLFGGSTNKSLDDLTNCRNDFLRFFDFQSFFGVRNFDTYLADSQWKLQCDAKVNYFPKSKF